MPLIVEDFTWTQNELLVIVKVPLHNKRPHEVDLFTSSRYIKAHFPPYLFEAALPHEIDEDKSKCTLRDNDILFELIKREPVSWTCIIKDLTKQELIRLKEEAIAEVHQKSQRLSSERAQLKSDRQHACVQQQLTLEETARSEIKRKKELLRYEAIDEFMRWKKNETDDHKTLLPLWKKLESETKKKALPPIALPKGQDDDAIFDDGAKKNKEKIRSKPKPKASTKVGKPLPPLAPVRRFINIKCDFTHRSFPTPSRESKFTEEEEWLSRQAEARRQTGFVAEDLRPEENNPEWLLEKGRSFHEVANYLGAVSAFSHAIKTWDKLPELYAARAASQIKLGNWRRAIFDATECLELCRPHVASNEEMRFLSHLHRGIGLMEVAKAKAALSDFVEALELRPGYAQLEHLIDRAESLASQQEAAETEETMRRLITAEEPKFETQYLSPADLAN